MLYAIVAVMVIILDQWVKFWVASNIALDTGVQTLIPGVVSLVNLHNKGVAFSFLSGSPSIVFVGISAAIVLVVVLMLATNLVRGRFSRWCLVFVAAGGVANCIDRLLYSYVQDMFRIEFFDFAIFNVADIFISVFCVLFILSILFRRDSDEDYDDYDDDEYYDEDEEDEDEDYDDEPVNPSKRSKKAGKRVYDDDEDEEPKPRRRRLPEAEDAEPAPAPARKDSEYASYKKKPASKPKADLFDDWDKEIKDAPKPVRSAAKPAEVPAAKPAAKPAPAPKAAAADDFDLDSILDEFR